MGEFYRLSAGPLLRGGHQVDERLVAAFHHEFLEQVLEIGAFKPGAHMRERLLVVQVGRRIGVVVEPAGQSVHGKGHAVGDAAVAFAQVEGHLRQARAEQVLGDPIAHERGGLVFND